MQSNYRNFYMNLKTKNTIWHSKVACNNAVNNVLFFSCYSMLFYFCFATFPFLLHIRVLFIYNAIYASYVRGTNPKFDLTTRDSYFTILVEVRSNYILAENILHDWYRVKITQDDGLKTCK